MSTIPDKTRRVVARLMVILAAACFVVAPMEALAHARMIRSSPTAEGVAQSPEQVEMWFNELLDGGFNSVMVYPAAEAGAKTHTSLTQGEAKVDPKDKTHLTVAVKPRWLASVALRVAVAMALRGSLRVKRQTSARIRPGRPASRKAVRQP